MMKGMIINKIKSWLHTRYTSCCGRNSWYKPHWRFDKETVPELLPNYSFDEVMYHIRQCQLNEFFFQASGNITGTCYTISDLSPKGHEFLSNIRNDSFYNKVKDIGAELGVQSLKDLTQIALSAASLVIKSHFNLPWCAELSTLLSRRISLLK